MSEQIKIEKTQVLAYPCDFHGCGSYRVIFPFTYLNSIAGPNAGLTFQVNTNWIGDGAILAQQRNIIFQRMTDKSQLDRVTGYYNFKEKLNYKMTYEIDDDIWNIPFYNKATKFFGQDKLDNAKKIIKMCDTVTVTNERLKNHVADITKFNRDDIKVVPNFIPDYAVPKTFKKKTTVPKIPRVLFAGSPSHFSNELKDPGDFPQELINYLINAVNNNEITLHVLGTRPFFLETLGDKVTYHEWVGTFDYYSKLKEIDPNFCIAPLKPNKFNESKSDIKYRECSTLNIFFIGTTFRGYDFDGPYDNAKVTLTWDAKEDEYRKIVTDHKNIHKYNEVIESQYQQAIDEKYWLSDNVELLFKAYAR